MNWRAVFVLFGLLGIAWALGWYRWFRDDPSERPAVSAAELARIVSGREPGGGHHEGWAYWKRLFGHRNTLTLCLMYFPKSFAFYFCITWLPAYLKERHGFDAMSLGVFAGLPLILSVLGDLFGGITTDVFTKRFGLRIGRCGVGGTAYVLAGSAMILAAVARQPVLAASLIAVGVGTSMFTLGASWSTCVDIGGNHAGVVSAAMNTSGQVGSVLSPLMVTFLLEELGSWDAPLFVMGSMFLLGAISSGFVDPRKRIFEQ